MKTLEFLRKHAVVLSSNEMKAIGGGCGYLTSSGSYSCNVTKAEALFMVSGGGNWCCASCGTSSYCGHREMT